MSVTDSPERWNSNLTLLSHIMDNYDAFVFINPIISSDAVVAENFTSQLGKSYARFTRDEPFCDWYDF
jgi:hypothetical protein